MRLWHEDLIPYLPRQQLLGQHRECCALRGNGWGRKHATVGYVFNHPYGFLVAYHIKVMQEMSKRGYHVDKLWYVWDYRGKSIGIVKCDHIDEGIERYFLGSIVYPEHNDAYLKECIQNLQGKGVDMNRAIKDLGVIL